MEPETGMATSSVFMRLALCLLIEFAASCSQRPCPNNDKSCLTRAQEADPVARIAFWHDALQQPVGQRFGPAPAQLAEYIDLDNRKNGFNAHPQPATIDDAFRRDVEAAIAGMPDEVKRLVGQHLAGVYFVTDLGSSGFTDKILDEQGKPVAAYVVLDRDVLMERTANAWATWKENTPFKPADGYRLTTLIETPPNDTRANAIQYILLHEFGHVLAAVGHFHPPWWSNELVKNPTAYPYFALSWQADAKGEGYEPHKADDFASRKDVVYYLTPKLESKQMVDIYTALSKTDFPTLYATTNPFDDFADSFANYVHVVMLHKPFEIDIGIHGVPAYTYAACWNNERCAAKRAILEKTLAAR